MVDFQYNNKIYRTIMALRDVSSYQELIEFVVKNNGIAIVEFHTSCEPCKLIQPHLLSLRNTYKVPLARVDTEKADELVSKFDIHALPTFLLIRKIGSDIEIAKTVVSAHVQKLTKLFQIATDIRGIKK